MSLFWSFFGRVISESIRFPGNPSTYLTTTKIPTKYMKKTPKSQDKWVRFERHVDCYFSELALNIEDWTTRTSLKTRRESFFSTSGTRCVTLERTGLWLRQTELYFSMVIRDADIPQRSHGLTIQLVLFSFNNFIIHELILLWHMTLR